MILGEYPTPGDVKVFIGDFYIDDAYRIDYEEQNRKVPLRGYHQKKYASVADGQQIVMGNIIIHYRFPGYLTYAIKAQLNRREENLALAAGASMFNLGASSSSDQNRPLPRAAGSTVPRKDSVMNAINKFRRLTVPERVDALVASHDSGTYEQTSALLRAMFDAETGGENDLPIAQDPLESVVEMDPGQYIGGARGIDLRVYYGYVGTATRGTYVTEELRGVHFTGRRKVVNAATSGGDLSASGQSLLEVYPFFARDVRSLLSDKPLQFVT